MSFKRSMRLPLTLAAFTIAATLPSLALAAEAAPKVPPLGRDFVDVAIDVFMYRTGVSEKEAKSILTELKEAFDDCVAASPGKPQPRCLYSHPGVVLKYDEKTREFVYTARYGNKSRDGRPDFKDEDGAEQAQGKVRVWAGDKSSLYPAIP